MLFHWRQNTQIALHPSGIVITDIAFLLILDSKIESGIPCAAHTRIVLTHAAPVTEIPNGTQIEFIPLEFCYIGEPLLIGLCGIKLPVQWIPWS